METGTAGGAVDGATDATAAEEAAVDEVAPAFSDFKMGNSFGFFISALSGTLSGLLNASSSSLNKIV